MLKPPGLATLSTLFDRFSPVVEAVRTRENLFEKILFDFTQEYLEELDAKLGERSEISLRELITLIVDGHFESLQKLEAQAKLLFPYTPQFIPHVHFKKSDDAVSAFLLKKIERYGLTIRDGNQEHALFLVSQGIRAVMFMTFINYGSNERKLIKEQLVEMLAGYLEG